MKERTSLPNTILKGTCPRVPGGSDGEYTAGIFLPLDWDVPDGHVDGVLRFWFR